MDFSQFLNNQSLLNLFFKAFAYVFSVIYLLFAIVIYKQTQVMNRTLKTGAGNIIVFISFLQITVALIVLLFAFILV